MIEYYKKKENAGEFSPIQKNYNDESFLNENEQKNIFVEPSQNVLLQSIKKDIPKFEEEEQKENIREQAIKAEHEIQEKKKGRKKG